jgi:hypothetical protein
MIRGKTVYTRLMAMLIKLFRRRKYGLGESTKPIEPAKSELEIGDDVMAMESKVAKNLGSSETDTSISFTEFVKPFGKKNDVSRENPIFGK